MSSQTDETSYQNDQLAGQSNHLDDDYTGSEEIDQERYRKDSLKYNSAISVKNSECCCVIL